MSAIRKSVIVSIAMSFATAVASAGVVTFETLSEGSVVTNQYASLGVSVAGNAVVLTAGSLLNEIDFPPHSGTNVIADLNGPLTFTFAPLTLISVGAYFTY